jgi:hypothetical protein
MSKIKYLIFKYFYTSKIDVLSKKKSNGSPLLGSYHVLTGNSL